MNQKTHETPLKKPIRGWYTDPAPGFKDLKGKFDDAARSAGTTKIAYEAIAAVLQKYSLFQGSKDPVSSFVNSLKSKNFGYGKDPEPQGRGSNLSMRGYGPRGGGLGDLHGATNEQDGAV